MHPQSTPIQPTGRHLASHGYVLLTGLKGHPMASRNGQVYEHRWVASQMLGRLLLPTERVHHKDHNKANNDPSNLEVYASQAEHFVQHRTRESRLPGEPNPLIVCACGCGEKFLRYDRYGRPRKFAEGHGLAGQLHPRAKLNEAAVLEIRQRACSGEDRTALASEFGVCKDTVNKVVLGKLWRHTGGPLLDRLGVDPARRVRKSQAIWDHAEHRKFACEGCGAEFTSRTHQSVVRFCSELCRHRAWRRERRAKGARVT